MRPARPLRVGDYFDYRRLRAVREEAGFTQERLDRMISGTYHHYENGMCAPSLRTLRTIFNVLGLDPFTVASILKLNCINPELARRFRATCKRLNQTPKQVMEEFLNVFCSERD